MDESSASDCHQSPVYWFYLLHEAVEAGDFVRAAEAQRQLERLGITVRYRMRSPKANGPQNRNGFRLKNPTLADDG